MSANIEALVKKHIDRDGWSLAPDGEVASAIRNALTEQAEAFKGELQAYDGMVRELTKTVEDMRAAQSVPVVRDAVAYLKADAAGKVLWSEDCVCEDAVWAGEDSEFGEYSLPVYRKPTHSITAAELATLREKAAEADELRKDAERYRWLREQYWNESDICVIRNPKESVKLGHDCPSFVRLDTAIDAAITQSKGE